MKKIQYQNHEFLRTGFGVDFSSFWDGFLERNGVQNKKKNDQNLTSDFHEILMEFGGSTWRLEGALRRSERFETMGRTPLLSPKNNS